MIHHVKESEVVPFSPAQMFKLVADIDHYEDFLPWCSGSKVLDRKKGEVLAEIRLAYGPIKASFTTHNENHPDSHIDLHLVHGPLKQLEGRWRFEQVSQGRTRVSLDLRFELSHMVLGVLLGEIISEIAGALLLSFRERASALYGKRRGSRRRLQRASPQHSGPQVTASKRKFTMGG